MGVSFTRVLFSFGFIVYFLAKAPEYFLLQIKEAKDMIFLRFVWFYFILNFLSTEHTFFTAHFKEVCFLVYQVPNGQQWFSFFQSPFFTSFDFFSTLTHLCIVLGGVITQRFCPEEHEVMKNQEKIQNITKCLMSVVHSISFYYMSPCSGWPR